MSKKPNNRFIILSYLLITTLSFIFTLLTNDYSVKPFQIQLHDTYLIVSFLNVTLLVFIIFSNIYFFLCSILTGFKNLNISIPLLIHNGIFILIFAFLFYLCGAILVNDIFITYPTASINWYSFHFLVERSKWMSIMFLVLNVTLEVYLLFKILKPKNQAKN